ncbi:MAG TPA: leucyl/phenylalanyl-tRNA--protein transferase [Patescibacteria group bacterium]|nr:leucyl/phenylalanyl-tRNA--protein transferase [Patescibacteria group bacterium]
MTVFNLEGKDDFPPAERAGAEGLLAVGGDLLPRRLLRAYGRGIFPWYGEGEPILWWSPDPRFVLFPAEFHAGRSLKKILQRGVFTLTLDRAFSEVVRFCALPRPDQSGTWITPAMRDAYVALHRSGYAHSLEAWQDGKLAGGIYGISLGRCFFAESMFHLADNASKVALAALAEALRKSGFVFIDCQIASPHLAGWGARPISRRRYLELLRAGLSPHTLRGDWGDILPQPFS